MWAEDWYFPEIESYLPGAAGDLAKISHLSDHMNFVNKFREIFRLTEAAGTALRNEVLRGVICEKPARSFGSVDAKFVHQIPGAFVWLGISKVRRQ